MNTLPVITSSFTATSLMTAFSYFISSLQDKQFREPVLLNRLVHRLVPLQAKEDNGIAGWVIHYSVGMAFTMVYKQYWKKTHTTPSLQNGIILGGLSGLVGIGVWKTFLTLHPIPPKVDFKKYALHLFIAHVIFGVAASEAYKQSDNLLKN